MEKLDCVDKDYIAAAINNQINEYERLIDATDLQHIKDYYFYQIQTLKGILNKLAD